MLRQIKLLTKIRLCNTFRLNEIRYCKDPKAKLRFIGMIFVWVILMILAIGYVGGLSYVLCKAGMSDILFKILVMAIGMMSLIFTIIKASSIIFAQKDYELQMSLPVSKTAIIISRFLSMYLSNVFISLIIMLPSMVIYTYMEKVELYFWIYGLIGVLFVPLLPIAFATVMGAIITGISSRCEHKSIINTVLTVTLTIGLLLVNMNFTGIEQNGEDILELIKSIGVIMKDTVADKYPPAEWLGNAMVNNNILDFILFISISIGVFLLMLFILQRYYSSIFNMINSFNNINKFEMSEIHSDTIIKSLVRRELKHYFSCSIYVSNTIIGNILMVICSIILLVVGTSSIEEALGIEGIVVRTFPILSGMLPAIMPMTVSSISIEGKQLWIIKSLPIKTKDILLSKILANIIVAMPFYVIAEVIALIALRSSFMEVVWIIVLPLIYIMFSIILGIFINLKVPNFKWESEIQVVKQSIAVFITLIISMLSGIIPIFCSVVLLNVSKDIIFLIIAVVLTLVSLFIINRLKKIDFLKFV